MRGQMWSPGRPSTARREDRVRFWEAIARGVSSEEAAGVAGVSQAVGSRWFRQAGGMPPICLAPVSERYLCFAEREEIAILCARGAGVRAIARELGRSPSTISRELRRNASTRTYRLEYRASTAQWRLHRSAVGTLVERSTRFTMLLHLPRMAGHGQQPRVKNGPPLAGHGAQAVRDAIAESITTLPQQLRRSLTWDQGAEMAQHAQLRIDCGLDVS